MSEAKRPPLPVILLANDLLAGEVVFFAHGSWTPDPALAEVATEEGAAARLARAAAEALAANRVVDAYLVDVTLDQHGRPTPRHFRERFKTLGPSIRPDLGKQAEFPAPPARR
jgi:sulfite reductase (NADPH) hemoprotein beta-component